MAAALSEVGRAADPDGDCTLVADCAGAAAGAAADAVPDAANGLAGTPLPVGAAVPAVEPADALTPEAAVPEADVDTAAVADPVDDAWPAAEPAADADWPSSAGPQPLTDSTTPTATATPVAMRLFIESSP
ncbi:hypothetical protein [Kitasatospora sp. GP82]|uniref:hypothetical protein n=1 Tax=Kitasatospora sp. GP82 TaxID=3035089 RepID=UPI0024736D43|nr:hypothetical protein [Kitasatospora sp. GP82]